VRQAFIENEDAYTKESIMIKLQPISEENFDQVLELKASEKFVASNSYSLAQAYLSLLDTIATGELPRLPYAILNDETVIGFVMLWFCPLEDDDDPAFKGDYFWITRFMIDEKEQGKGYGKAAMAVLLDMFRAKLNGHEAKYVYLSYEPSNHVAAKLYESCGFTETGLEMGGEVVVELVL